MTSKPRIALAAATAVAGISLAGCGSGAQTPASQPAAPAQTLTASPRPSATTPEPSATSPAAQASVNPGGPAVTGGRTAECSASQLKIAYNNSSKVVGSLDGMSKADHVVTFTNDGSAPCQTRGYPGVAALNAAGTQIKQATRASGAAPLIILKPGQTASALVAANTASCTALTSVSGFLLTPPDQRTSTRLGSAGQFCLSSLTVQPLQPGSTAGLNL